MKVRIVWHGVACGITQWSTSLADDTLAANEAASEAMACLIFRFIVCGVAL